MIGKFAKRTGSLALLGAAAVAAIAFFGGANQPDAVDASSPGTTVAPILSCPNVNGSADNKVLVGDIVEVVKAYFKDYAIQAGEPPGTSDYVPMYDLNAPYNPATATGGNQRVDDIVAVVNAYFDTCPLVDTQVAQATLWAIDMDGNLGNGKQPVPQFENEAAIEAIGYYRTTTDVPGQGVHYVNMENWDGVFDPRAPEGLVYNNGRLAAQLYVADAEVVGLGSHSPGPCGPPCPGAEYGVELETAGDGPQCNPACSWDGTETWHLHHYLCTVNVGMASAIAFPGALAPGIADSAASCESYSDSVTNPDAPECTIPVTVQPCWGWQLNSGWMGHLYNWYPNNNLSADTGGPNGRFTDCFPDSEGWKATNCPG
jgi:hypothetical protein